MTVGGDDGSSARASGVFCVGERSVNGDESLKSEINLACACHTGSAGRSGRYLMQAASNGTLGGQLLSLETAGELSLQDLCILQSLAMERC